MYELYIPPEMFLSEDGCYQSAVSGGGPVCGR